jgi:LCP family protein required for cell wall assembly
MSRVTVVDVAPSRACAQSRSHQQNEQLHPVPETSPFGPPLHGGKPSRSRLRGAGIVVLSTGIVVLLGITVTTAALVVHGERSLTRIEVTGTTGSGEDNDEGPQIDEVTDIINVLVVGSDSREGLTEEQLLALGTEDHGADLTDSIVLVQLDPGRDQVVVLSFPRDLYVTRCDGSRGRINAAYHIGDEMGIGGASCLTQTVADFTGIPIDHYVQVNFAGFIEAVDVLDGVTMYFEEPLVDRYAGLDVPAGCVRMDGISALSFVRARHLDDDFGRMARQQRFMREMMREATALGTLLNVPRLFSLVDAVGRAVETDHDLSLVEMRRIAFSLRNLTPERLDTRTVPSVPRQIGDAAVVVAKEEEAEQLFQAFREGTVFPEEIGTQPPAEITAADVPPLVVLNGVGIAGLASEVAEAVEERGFEVAETGNADNFDFVTTQVIYPVAMLEEAELVSEALGGTSLVPGDEGTPITIVIGTDYDPDRLPPVEELAPPGPPTPEAEADYRGAQPVDADC